MSTRIKQNQKTTTTSRRVKENGYSHAKADARAAAKRSAADTRQAKYDGLSTAEKISLALSRRGASTRELAKLGA
jgi:hypothetical protein